MAGLDSSIYGNLKPPAQMSLGDLMNLATTTQAYKQAQQVNPETLRTATANAQSAEQTAATGGIDLQVAQQKNDERLALQDFFSNPDNFQTNGQMDINKINAAVPKIAPLTGTDVIKKIADVSQTQTTAKESSQKFKQNTRALVANTLSVAGRSGNQNPEYYKAELDNLLSSDPNNKELNDYVTSQKKLIDMAPPGTDLANGAIIHSQELLSAPEQQEAFAPKAGTVSAGGTIERTEIQPSVGTNKPTIKRTGTLASVTTTPEWKQDPVTGEWKLLSGGVGGAGTRSAVSPSGAVPNQPNANAIPNQNVAPGGGGAGGGFTQIQPGGTATTQQAQATSGSKIYLDAVDTMTNPNSPQGYLPGQKLVTGNILKLLKDPTVDTGPITNYFAGRSGQETLTPKQQELAKYLEQRIQNQNPSSQMDLQSKHTAYGSINLKKDALTDLMRNEAGQVTAKDLFNKGIITAGGTGNTPNINNVNSFKTKFSLYASDPELMKYIAIVGEQPKAHLDEEDQRALSKMLTGKNTEQRKSLSLRRQQLLKMVNGE